MTGGFWGGVVLGIAIGAAAIAVPMGRALWATRPAELTEWARAKWSAGGGQ